MINLVKSFVFLAGFILIGNVYAGSLTFDGNPSCGDFTGISIDGNGNATISGASTECVSGNGGGGQTIQYQVSVNGGGAGSGGISASGINCTSTAGTLSGDCSQSYDEGSSIALSASAHSGSTFGSWSGCPSANGAICNISSISALASVTASFNVDQIGGGGNNNCGNTTAIVIADERNNWPNITSTTAQNPNSILQNATESIWVKTSASGSETGLFAIVPTSTGGQTLRISISECPGDFDVADLPGDQSRCAFQGTDGSIRWTEGDPAGRKCNLQPDTEYYINMTFTTAAGGSTCSNAGAGCEMLYQMF